MKPRVGLIKYFLKSNNNFFSYLYSKKESNNIYKLISFLLVLTILFHIFIWILVNYLLGDIIWESSQFIKISSLFSLSKEGGYYEHLQYMILFWNCILSFLIYKKLAFRIRSLFILYTFLFLNNILSIHDYTYQNFLIPFLNNFSFISNIFFRIKDVAELVYWMVVLVIFISFSYFDYIKSSITIKKFLQNNYLLLFYLSFFSIFVDFVNANLFKFYSLSFIVDNPIYFNFFKIIHSMVYIFEEFGELSLISLIFIFLLKYYQKLKFV